MTGIMMHVVSLVRVPLGRVTRLAAVGACLVTGAVIPAWAGTMTEKDALITAKAIGFLDPSPTGGVIAVVFDTSNPASKADAASIVALFAGGLPEGGGSITAKLVDVADIGNASGYVAVIAASSSSGSKVMDAVKAAHIPCITADLAPVQAGQCVMSIQSDPKVDITVSHAAAAAAGISFKSAFSMLVHQI